MKEYLDIYDLKDKFLGVQERGTFYKEIEEEFVQTGKVSRKVKSIRVLLMNSQGRVYVQKRSAKKKHNAGLYDKTIGGHIEHTHTAHITLVKECAEELGIPAVMLTEEEFSQAVKSTNLQIIGIFKKMELVTNYPSVRQTGAGNFIQPFITTFIMGYYDGAIRFCDGESSGIEVFTLDELRKAIASNPDRYTDDLRFFIDKYSSSIVPLEEIIIPKVELM